MPTAGKLIGAVLFAALAYFVSDLIKPYLPEGSQVGLMSPINAFFGLIMGWRLLGRGVGHGYVSAIGHGLTALAATILWCLLLWGGYEMLIRSTRLRYDGPFEAIQDMSEIMLGYAVTASQSDVLITAFVGAIICAGITEFFAKRWS